MVGVLMPAYAYGVGTFSLSQAVGYPATFTFNSPSGTAADGFEFTDGWAGTIADVNYPATYAGFATPAASAADGFEFADGWAGTIADVNYPATYAGFSTPDASEVDGFETADGWPGT
jgi:hypothetical protein